MEPVAALQTSATALAVAAALFQLRLMYVAGPDLEDLQEAVDSERAKGGQRSVPLVAATFLLVLMSGFQFATWIASSWIYPFWNKALHFVPVAAWLGFVVGLRLLFLHHRFLKNFGLIERHYLAALVVINFALSSAITYFYAISS